MSWVRAKYAIPAAIVVIVAITLLLDVARGTGNTPKVDVTFIISDDLARKGGIVFVMPRKLNKDEFLSRYPSARTGPMLRSANLSDPVSFVHFDVPDQNYNYQFQRAENHTPPDQQQIGVGGAGAVYLDENKDPVFAALSLDHYIYGTDISLADAQSLQTATGDFTIGQNQCRQIADVKICVPDIDQIQPVLERSRKQAQ